MKQSTINNRMFAIFIKQAQPIDPSLIINPMMQAMGGDSISSALGNRYAPSTPSNRNNWTNMGVRPQGLGNLPQSTLSPQTNVPLFGKWNFPFSGEIQNWLATKGKEYLGINTAPGIQGSIWNGLTRQLNGINVSRAQQAWQRFAGDRIGTEIGDLVDENTLRQQNYSPADIAAIKDRMKRYGGMVGLPLSQLLNPSGLAATGANAVGTAAALDPLARDKGDTSFHNRFVTKNEVDKWQTKPEPWTKIPPAAPITPKI